MKTYKVGGVEIPAPDWRFEEGGPLADLLQPALDAGEPLLPAMRRIQKEREAQQAAERTPRAEMAVAEFNRLYPYGAAETRRLIKAVVMNEPLNKETVRVDTTPQTYLLIKFGADSVEITAHERAYEASSDWRGRWD